MKNQSYRRSWCISSFLAGILLLAANRAYPATRTWSGSGADSNWRTTANWDGAPTTNDVLVFAGVNRLANTNNFTAPTTFNGITFDATASAFVLSGNALRLAGDIINNSTTQQTVNVAITNTARLTVNCGADVILGGVISGNGSGVGLTKTGAATLKLSAANIYAGVTTNSLGTIMLNNAAALPAATTLVMLNGATLDLNGFNSTVANVSVSTTANTITNSAAGTGTNTFTISTTQNNNPPVSALIRDGATRVTAVDLSNANQGTAPFTLSNQNTFSGPLTLRHNGSGTRLTLNGTITTAGSPGAIVSGPFGRGPIILGLASTDKAGIFITTTVTLMNDLICNTTVGNDTPGIRIESANNVFSGTVIANLAPAYFVPRNNSGSVSLTGQVTGPSGLTLDGSSYNTKNITVILNNATPNPNNYRGPTTLTGTSASSTLQLGAANQIPNGATAGNVVLNGGTLKLAGYNETINGLTGAGTVDGTSGAPTLTLGDGDASGVTFSGTIKNTTGLLNLTKIGSGSQALSGVNTYGGNTTVTGGKLVGVTGGSCSNSTVFVEADAGQIFSVKITDNTKQWTCAAMVFNAGATALQFDFGYYGASVVPSTTVAPLVVNGNVQFNGTPVVTVDAGNLPVGVYPLMTWSGTAAGTVPTAAVLPSHVVGSLSVVGGNTLTLTVTSSTQPLTWAAGTGVWDFETTNWMDAASSATIYQETTLPGDTVFFDDSASGGGPFTVTLDTTVTPTAVAFTNSAKEYTLTGSGALAGVMSLTKQGNGTLTLDADSTFTGGTALNAGRLNLNKPAALGATANLFTIAGGVLGSTASSEITLNNNPQQWNADFAFLGNQNLNLGAGAVTLGGNRQVTVDSGTLTVGGVIAGSGRSLTKAGAGTLTLGGANTYNGGTVINAGAVDVAAVNGLGTGAVTVGPNGVLNLTSLAINDITYSGLSTALSGSGTVNVTLTNQPNTSTRSLNGNYSGFTGTWNVGVGAGPGYGKVQMTGFDNGAATINILSNATLFTLTATHQSAINLYGGDTGEGYGQLRLDSGTWAGPITLAGEINSPDGFVGGYSGSATLSGPIGETGGPRTLSKVGGNTMILSGTNTFTGGTSIRGGILQVNASESMGGGDVSFNGGVRLSLGNGVTVTNAIFIGANNGVAVRALIESSSGSATLAGPVIINTNALAGGHFGASGGSTLYVNGPVLSTALVYSRVGTVVFSGGGAYRNIDLSQDTLRLGADNGLCPTSTFNIASSATAYFDMAGFDQTIYQVTKGGSGATIWNSSTNKDSLLTVTGSSTYAGVIADRLGFGTNKVALTVTGGTLALTGANSFSGVTTVDNGGTLSVNADAALGAVPASATPGLIVLSNGTLRATATSTMNPARGILLATGTSNVLDNTSAGTLMTYKGAIEGAGSLTVTGAGGWDLGGASTYTGGTMLEGGLVAVGSSSAGTAGDPASGPFGAGTAAVVLSGSQLRATTAYGVPDVTVGNALIIETNTTFASGTAGAYSDKNLTFTGPATLAASVTLTVNTTPATGGVALNGAINDGGNAFGLTKAGVGTLTLGGVNTYSGPTTNSAGKLVLVTGGSCAASVLVLGNGTSNSVCVTDNTAQWSCPGMTFSSGSASVLEFAFGSTVPGTTVAPLQVNGDVAFDGTPTVSVAADVLRSDTSYPLMTWTGTQTGTAPTAVILPPRVSGSLRLDGSTLYLDVTTGFAQPLRWGVSSATWDIDTTANWKDSSAVPSAVTYYDKQAVQLEDTQSGAGPITVTLNTTVKPATVTVNNPAKDYTVSGSGKISGSTGITKSGAGTLTLSTANDYIGATSVAEGTVKLGAAAGLGATAGETTVASGAVLDLNGQAVGAEPVNVNGGSLVNSNTTAATLSGPVAAVAAGSVGGCGTLTLSGVVSGGATLNKVGTNTLVLSAANTHNGVLVIHEGTVRTGNAAALGSAAVGTTVASGGTLDVYNMNLGAEPVTATGPGVDQAGAIVNTTGSQINALRFVTLTGDTTFGGTARWDIRSNPTALFDMGGYTLTKTNVNTVCLVGATVVNPGNVNVQQGIFSLETGTVLGGGAANTMTVQGGATLQFYQLAMPSAWTLALNSNATVYANQGSGTQNTWAGPVILGGGPATLSCAQVLSISGAITGTGPLVKAGASSATLTGESTYGGGTVVSAGTLQLGNGTTSNGSVAGDITNSATVIFANPSEQSYDGAISGAGILVKQNNGTLTLSGNSSYTGETQLKAGIVNVATLANYGMSCALGARTLALETAAGTIGLHFMGGTLQYTGATPQSTDRMLRLLGSATGVTNTIDASGTGEGTLSFTYSGKNTNFWDTAGKRTLQLTGSNEGDNTFAINIQDHSATTLIKGGPGKWLVTNTHNGDPVSTLNATYGGYTGGTLIGGGWLAFATNALGSTGLITMSASSVLEWYGFNSQDISSRLKLEDGVTATLDTGTNSVSFASALQLGTAKSAALTKAGSGTLTLSATNGFTGATTVNAGTLRLGVTNALVSGAAVTLAGGALDLNGKSQILVSLGGTGTLKMNPATGPAFGDRLTVNGELDLTNLSLELANLDLLDRGQTYMLASAGTLTGRFAAIQPTGHQSGWRTHYDTVAGAVSISYSRGTIFLLQ